VEKYMLTFDKADANNLVLAIPGPIFDGTEFSDRLLDLQKWLRATGHEDDAEELESALEDFEEASETIHGAVIDVLEKHDLM